MIEVCSYSFSRDMCLSSIAIVGVMSTVKQSISLCIPLQSYSSLKSVNLKCGKCWVVANLVIDVVVVSME